MKEPKEIHIECVYIYIHNKKFYDISQTGMVSPQPFPGPHI